MTMKDDRLTFVSRPMCTSFTVDLNRPPFQQRPIFRLSLAICVYDIHLILSSTRRIFLMVDVRKRWQLVHRAFLAVGICDGPTWITNRNDHTSSGRKDS